MTVGDVFGVRMGEAAAVVIEGGGERFDRVGAALAAGTLVVEGDVGVEAGRSMTGGRSDDPRRRRSFRRLRDEGRRSRDHGLRRRNAWPVP